MKDLISSVFTILKYGGKAVTIFRNIIFNIIFLFIIVLVGLAFFSKEDTSIGSNNALLLTISGNIVDEKQIIDPLSELFNDLLGFSQLPEETLLQDILDAIHAAEEDERINSIVLDLSDMGVSSISQIRDVGKALINFKTSGKPVIAAEDFYTQDKYLLASYADRVFLNPIGLVDLHGLGAYQLYFKDALQKLKINYHVFRVGTYKSAVEPLTRNSMSDEAKRQNSVWLNNLWQEFRKDITSRRDISYDTIELYTNQVSSLLKQSDGDTARLAFQANLVDELMTRQDLRSYLADITGPSAEKGFRHVTFKEYLKKIPRSYGNDGSTVDSVGIIVAQGNILTGEQPPGTIGSESLVNLLYNARNDDSIKAIVLRINSGGGSVIASEIIRHELLELKKSGKPYVVSMGAMAASGGYWIAADADEIWAYPTTLTGSIGIFGAIPTFEDSLAGLGIYSDGIGTSKLSSGLNLTQPLSQELQDAVQLTIEHGYRRFLEIVSSGRNIERDKLDLIAQGRVFDGTTAKELGLVDKLGSLDEAIRSAASLANLEKYSTRYIKGRPSISEILLQQLHVKILAFFSNGKTTANIFEKLQIYSKASRDLLLFNDPKGIYAHCMINYY